MPEAPASLSIDNSQHIRLSTPKSPPCPACRGATQERAVPEPRPGEPAFMIRKRTWFDCAPCGRYWEACGICHRGALVEGSLWGEPNVRRIDCKGGCGWGVAWREDYK
jgi:hypothetical protein